uniref:Putative secreted protein n=1 Tax=Ixodes scapularis TaxID=6945 RepID=A0A4D5RDI7_IXOSC
MTLFKLLSVRFTALWRWFASLPFTNGMRLFWLNGIETQSMRRIFEEVCVHFQNNRILRYSLFSVTFVITDRKREQELLVASVEDKHIPSPEQFWKLGILLRDCF